jgi:polyketide biosynthesis enoyl-CoA hydratase PksI
VTGLFAATPLGDGVVSLCVATEATPHFEPSWVDAFIPALARLGDDASVRVVLLEGARYFSAGARPDGLLEAASVAKNHAARLPRALVALPVPVVAAMAGHAIGGGLLLGLWCDARVLSVESLYGANFMALGFTPGMGATFAVPEAFGAPLGRELLWTGRLMTGREIRDACCPLSYAVQPRSEVVGRALAVARDIAATPRDVVALFKAQVAVGRLAALESALKMEAESHAQLLVDADRWREGRR